MNEPQLNPFDFVKASDFSDEQIDQYWVDIAGERGLEDLFQPLQKTPMLLLGGKGSGKTHLMRYFSAPVRKLKNGGKLRDALINDGYLGVYVQADGLNAGRFHDKGADDAQWASIFSFYFELWLASQVLKNANELLLEDQSAIHEEAFVEEVASLFLKKKISSPLSLRSLLEHLTAVRKDIDYIVGNITTGRSQLAEVDITVSPGELIFGIPEALSKHLSADLRQTLFVYMIDEVENFTEIQQKFLNSLIRYRKGPVSIKVGARLYGLRTRDTMGGSEERIRNGAEYTQVELDEWLRENEDAYKELASKIIAKRLEATGIWDSNRDNSASVKASFAEPDRTNHFQRPLIELVKKYDNQGEPRPYFEELREQINSWGSNDDRAKVDEIVKKLQLKAYPLLEKVNIYLLYRDWRSDKTLLELASNIQESAAIFLSGPREAGAEDYADTYAHFQSDFIAQIARECKMPRIDYAGLPTLIHLSQGFPRNLLGLLKQIYRRSLFAGEQPFKPGCEISVRSQNDGVRDAAAWFWDDAQPDSHGPEARSAVQALAELFSGIRYSLKPAECAVGTFTVAHGGGTEKARTVLSYAQNWSYLIQIKGIGSDRNNANAVDDKYQLSPMLAPRWEVSERRRGAIRLSDSLFNAIFDPTKRDSLSALARERLSAMQNPGNPKGQTNQNQDRLF
jgi:hypothetical protein